MPSENLYSMIVDDRPRSLRDTAERERRRDMLRMAHMTPLTGYVESLRQLNRGEVPDFDPMDGGVHARVLFLFEKPGPMTSQSGERVGSGFISRNNDDPTAEATFHFAAHAGIPRRESVIWNFIPWWNGTRRITRDEMEHGEANVAELIRLLPELRGVILVGRRAARAKRSVEAACLPVVTSFHPSPLVRARTRERWENIPSDWARITGVI